MQVRGGGRGARRAALLLLHRVGEEPGGGPAHPLDHRWPRMLRALWTPLRDRSVNNNNYIISMHNMTAASSLIPFPILRQLINQLIYKKRICFGNLLAIRLVHIHFRFFIYL
jgi:hypothetical protein